MIFFVCSTRGQLIYLVKFNFASKKLEANVNVVLP